MNATDARAELGRVLTAFPSFRQWLEGTDQPNTTLDLWCNILADCDASDVAEVVSEIVSGNLDPVGRYEKPDALPKNIKREANDRRFKRQSKQTQQENYHGHSRGAMAAVRKMRTGYWSITLGSWVKQGKITEQENDVMLEELIEWDRNIINGIETEKPDWMTND